MERGSDKHGARMDDALAAEVQGMMQAERETRGEEWNSPEPSGEDQPDVDRAPNSTLAGGVPEGLTEEDVERRSQIAGYLGKEIWPAGSAQILEKARELDAPDDIVDQLSRLPADGVYANVQDVYTALSGGGETHRF